MGSGQEGGSPSTAMVFATTKQSTSALAHKLQREELLDGGSGSYIDAPTDLPSSMQNPKPNTLARTPRAGNTPLQSPRSMSPLRSLSSTEIVSSEIASATLVDFQEAILRASHAQKTMPMAENYSMRDRRMDLQVQTMPSFRVTEELGEEVDQNEAAPALATAVTGSKADIGHSQGLKQLIRQKSPFPSGRMRPSKDMVEETSLSTIRADPTHASASEWVHLARGKSPRRTKASSSSLATQDEPQEAPVKHKSSRSSTRRSKADTLEELPDADLGMGDANRATRRSHTRSQARQHKRKASESISVVAGASSPPESHVVHRAPPPQQHVPEYHPPPYRIERHSTSASTPLKSSSGVSREARTITRSDWLQFLGDIIMWKHTPRSALLFGAGCFCIMSASLVQDMQYSSVSFVAYLALFYLAARFIKCNFSRGLTQTLIVDAITEADVLSLIKVVLPPFNIMLQKLGDLFCGEPIVTMKVAGALWLLARAGSMMNMWTLTRIAYFSLFTLPKCYASYHEQIKAQARHMLQWMRTTWSSCGHKKAVMLTAFVVAWNFSSVSTRICGAFLALVGVRAYQHVLRTELELGSYVFNQNRHAKMNY